MLSVNLFVFASTAFFAESRRVAIREAQLALSAADSFAQLFGHVHRLALLSVHPEEQEEGDAAAGEQVPFGASPRAVEALAAGGAAVAGAPPDQPAAPEAAAEPAAHRPSGPAPVAAPRGPSGGQGQEEGRTRTCQTQGEP